MQSDMTGMKGQGGKYLIKGKRRVPNSRTEPRIGGNFYYELLLHTSWNPANCSDRLAVLFCSSRRFQVVRIRIGSGQ